MKSQELIKNTANIYYSVDDDRFYTSDLNEAAKKLDTILTLCFHIGYSCNLKCPYCLSPFSNTDLPLIDLEVIRTFVQENAIKRIVISGGEPFLYTPVLEQLLPILKSSGCAILISTNGTQPINTMLKYASLVDWYDISLPASNRALYKKIRGSDCFDIVINNIKALISYGCRVRISYTVASSNIDDLESLRKLVTKLKVKNVRIGHTYCQNSGAINNNLDYTNMFDCFRIIQGRISIYFPLSEKELHYYNNGYVILRSDGNLYKCYIDESTYMGNIKKSDVNIFYTLIKHLSYNQAKLFVLPEKG